MTEVRELQTYPDGTKVYRVVHGYMHYMVSVTSNGCLWDAYRTTTVNTRGGKQHNRRIPARIEHMGVIEKAIEDHRRLYVDAT